MFSFRHWLPLFFRFDILLVLIILRRRFKFILNKFIDCKTRKGVALSENFPILRTTIAGVFIFKWLSDWLQFADDSTKHFSIISNWILIAISQCKFTIFTGKNCTPFTKTQNYSHFIVEINCWIAYVHVLFLYRREHTSGYLHSYDLICPRFLWFIHLKCLVTVVALFCNYEMKRYKDRLFYQHMCIRKI